MSLLKDCDFYIKSKSNEETITVSIGNTIIGTIDKNDAYAIDTIKRIVGSSEGKTEIKSFLSSIGIPQSQQDSLITLLGGESWPRASSYLLNRIVDVSTLIGKISSSYDLNCELLGITNRKISDELFSFQWPTQPSMGKGEVWLALIIDGGSKSKVGDFSINGVPVEVKGSDARLVGPRGFGDAKKMGYHIRSALIDICNNLGINYTPSVGTSNDWNITKVEGRLLEKSLKEMSNIRGGFSYEDVQLISNFIINSYKNVFTGLQITKYDNILVEIINEDGSFDPNKFNIELLKMSFEYYHQIEQFEYLAMINYKSGNFLIIRPSEFATHVENGNINYTPPSWGDKAGNQGGFFSIKIK